MERLWSEMERKTSWYPRVKKKSYAKGVTVFQWILFTEHMEGIKLASSHYNLDRTPAKNEILV